MTIEIDVDDLAALIYYARRYCDTRKTYAPTEFNQIYNRLMAKYPEKNSKAYGLYTIIGDQRDITLKELGRYWPFAQDGMNKTEGDGWDTTKEITRARNDNI